MCYFQKIIKNSIIRRRFSISWLTLHLLPYLVYFIIFFAWHSYFCFVRNFIISFVIDKMDFRSVDITVDFFKWSLWKMLTIFKSICLLKMALSYFFLLYYLSIQLNNIALIDVCLLFGINCAFWMVFILYSLSLPVSNSDIDKNLFIYFVFIVFCSKNNMWKMLWIFYLTGTSNL